MKPQRLASLRIVHYPDPVLKRVAADVREFGPDLEKLASRMFELMRLEQGVGLAAPQVGISLRLFICNPTGEPSDDLVCVNPQLDELTGGEEKEEGCLSIPGATVTMRRAVQAVLTAYDVKGQLFRRSGTDLIARIWQHEVDHLNGRLIIDNLSPSDEIANRRVLRQLRSQFKPATNTR